MENASEKMSSIKVNKRPVSRRRRRPISVKKKSWMRTPISRKDDEKIHSSPPELCYGAEGLSEEYGREGLPVEDDEEEKKYIRRSPVFIPDLKDFLAKYRLRAFRAFVKDYGAEEPEEPEVESEEELLLECDRNEVDWGYNYVLRKRWRAITNPVVPKKIYYKSTMDCYPIQHVLHDPECPLATLSKLAIRNYNDIQGTRYEYVGLVKAYMRTMAGFRYYIRFKARLLAQDAINFEATLFQGIRNRKTNSVPVTVSSVYPLTPC